MLVSATVVVEEGLTENLQAVWAAVGVEGKSGAVASTLDVASAFVRELCQVQVVAE